MKQTRIFLSTAALMLAAASAMAASLTIHFEAPEDATFDQVSITLREQVETPTGMSWEPAKTYETTDKNFSYTFDEMEAKRYVLQVKVSAEELKDRFVHSKLQELTEEGNELTIKYEPMDPGKYRGEETANAVLHDFGGQPVGGKDVRVIAIINGEELEIGHATSAEDGTFAIEGLATEQLYHVFHDKERLGLLFLPPMKVKSNAPKDYYLSSKSGDPAPNIEYMTAFGEGEELHNLTDHRGKLVILDFWASWCGPCQPVTKRLAELKKERTDWEDKVVILPVSIDEKRETIQKHLEKHADEFGGLDHMWQGDKEKAHGRFRVNAIPAGFLIGPEGKILGDIHPTSADFEEHIDKELAKMEAGSET